MTARKRDLMAVVSVVKRPVAHSPRLVSVVATIHLQDGTSYDLTEDGWGKRNFEVNVASHCKGDELFCVSPPDKKLVLVGSEAGVKRLR